ncbi:MAG: hypothetical protein EOO43_08400 [Flavobacterium sp.]|nr:MAG: hypothetical protein EOO43_08400 [Flavobacterium sp.]
MNDIEKAIKIKENRTKSDLLFAKLTTLDKEVNSSNLTGDALTQLFDRQGDVHSQYMENHREWAKLLDLPLS